MVLLNVLRAAAPLFLAVTLLCADSELRLKRGGRSASISDRRSAEPVYRLHWRRSHRIVQFPEPPRPEVLQELERRGASVAAYVPDNAYLIQAPDDIDLTGLNIQWTGTLDPDDKLGGQIDSGEETRLLVEFHRDVEPADARAIARRHGLSIQEHPDLPSHQLLVRGDGARLAELTHWDEVAYLFPASDALIEGLPVEPCVSGSIGQYVARIGDGWDGPGRKATELNYSFQEVTSQLPAAATQKEVERALAEWARHAQIDFRLSGAPAEKRNINILFATAAHGDRYPFDGPGRVLAHTFYPSPPNPEPIAGDVHFDDDETWRMGSHLDVYSVALHELGHALGLGHSDVPGSVMYPFYSPADHLTQEDIAALQLMYLPRHQHESAPPRIDITHPSRGPSFAASEPSVLLRGSAIHESGIVRVTWAISGGASGEATGTTQWQAGPIPLRAGVQSITITAYEPAGASALAQLQVTYGQTRTVIKDRTPPSMTILFPGSPNLLTSASTIVIRGTARDNMGVESVSWSSPGVGAGPAEGTSNWFTPSIRLLVGTNVITIRARDASGNSSWRSVTVTRR